MKKGKRWLRLFLAGAVLVVMLTGCEKADVGAEKAAETLSETIQQTADAENDTEEVIEDAGTANDIVILYTNDVHTYIDGPISYDVIAAVKKELQAEYGHVLLADAGDHIQGTAYGSMDNGETIVKLMNAAGYDVATLGNHEFDYGMFGCMKTIDMAEYPYVSCNFYNEAEGVRGENVLNSYELFKAGEETIAIVGITTPETYTKTTPAYFQDEAGNFIYGISGRGDGSELYADVQKAIDEAKESGATKVIALGHLGDDLSSRPWTSEETIANVEGLDAFIDGHSHRTVEGKTVTDKSGEEVLLTQTGEYFNKIGMMVIDAETGSITTDFIECKEILATDGETVEGYELYADIYDGTELVFDAEVKEIKEAWLAEIDNQLGQKVGSAELILNNYDTEGNRMVRSQETNTGDFCADALYYLFDSMEMDVDVSIMNGGGIRNEAVTGDISYKICKNIHTFGNCLVIFIYFIIGILKVNWRNCRNGIGTDGLSVLGQFNGFLEIHCSDVYNFGHIGTGKLAGFFRQNLPLFLLNQQTFAGGTADIKAFGILAFMEVDQLLQNLHVYLIALCNGRDQRGIDTMKFSHSKSSFL